MIGTLVRPIRRGKHHVLAVAFVHGRWMGHTVCGRVVDRSTWTGWQEGQPRWAPEDGCQACGYATRQSAETQPCPGCGSGVERIHVTGCPTLGKAECSHGEVVAYCADCQGGGTPENADSPWRTADEPCPSGDTDCTVDCGSCKGTGRRVVGRVKAKEENT